VSGLSGLLVRRRLDVQDDAEVEAEPFFDEMEARRSLCDRM
jgi:hypothetical protein